MFINKKRKEKKKKKKRNINNDLVIFAKSWQKEIQEEAKAVLSKVQEEIKKYVDRKRAKVDKYKVENLVMLSTKDPKYQMVKMNREANKKICRPIQN